MTPLKLHITCGVALVVQGWFTWCLSARASCCSATQCQGCPQSCSNQLLRWRNHTECSWMTHLQESAPPVQWVDIHYMYAVIIYAFYIFAFLSCCYQNVEEKYVYIIFYYVIVEILCSIFLWNLNVCFVLEQKCCVQKWTGQKIF